MVMNRAAASALSSCDCPSADTPDDMHLGMCARSPGDIFMQMNELQRKNLGALKFQSCTVEGCSRCRYIEYENGKSGSIINSRLARRITPPPSLPTGSQFPSTSTGRSTHSRCLSLIISFISLDQTIVIHFKLCLFLSVVRCTRTTLQSLMPSWGTPIVMSFRKRMRKPEGRVVIDLFGIYLHYII